MAPRQPPLHLLAAFTIAALVLVANHINRVPRTLSNGRKTRLTPSEPHGCFRLGRTFSDLARGLQGGGAGEKKITNSERGNHDDELSGLLKSHGGNANLVLDTVMEYLTRDGGMSAKPGLQAMIRGLAGAGKAEPVEVDPNKLLDLKISMDDKPRQEFQEAYVKWKEAGGYTVPAPKPASLKPTKICTHAGCNRKYVGPESEGAPCRYHPGGPVFHEGEKYWSCCRKRTIDFSEFINMPGCAHGRCTFKQDLSAQASKDMPRHDMTESGQETHFTIYARKIDPNSLVLQASHNKLRIKFTYEFTRYFNIEVNLRGPVLPRLSTGEVSGSKLEIVLRKGDGTHWQTVGKLIDLVTGAELKQKSEFALPTI